MRQRKLVKSKLSLATVVTGLCSASAVGCQHDTARICCRHLLHGARSYTVYLLPTGRSAANSPAAVAAVDRRDRRTDGRTPDRYIDPVAHTMRAASVSELKWNRDLRDTNIVNRRRELTFCWEVSAGCVVGMSPQNRLIATDVNRDACNISTANQFILANLLSTSSVFTCIGALGTPFSRTGPLARKYLPGFPYSWSLWR